IRFWYRTRSRSDRECGASFLGLSHVPVSRQFEAELARLEALERSGPFAVADVGAQGEAWYGCERQLTAAEHLQTKTVVGARFTDAQCRGRPRRAIESRAAADVWPEPQIVAHATRQ